MSDTVSNQVARALQRVPSMDHQSLLTLLNNATKFGEAAAPLVAAINERIESFESAGGMAVHRLEFARCMMRVAMRSPRQWVASRDLFNRARLEFADNPYVIWMAGNSARQIPLTKALETVQSEFPSMEYRKDGMGQSDRVFYRYTP